MKNIAAIVICFLLPLLLTAQQAAKQPNIILVVADDLGYGDLGCYGQKKIKTPHIDQLARQGIRFNSFYAGTSVCAPSRASLMTGLHTGHVQVRGNKSTKPEGQTPLPDSVITFVNRLQQAGYATGAFGKWGLGYVTSSGAPDKKGFDKFFGYNCQSLAHDYYPDHLWNNQERVEFAGNPQSRTTYSGDLIHEQAINFIKNTDKPFFLFLPYTLPHAEVIAPRDSVFYSYVQQFNEKHDTAKRYYDNRVLQPYPHASFAAMVTRLDRYVGEIRKAVEEKGIADNTLIIFTSDNGPHKEGGGDPEFFDSNGKLRGIKRDLYEGGIRVPLIAYWPGKIKPDSNWLKAAFWDIYPTFLELAGISAEKNIDGISIVPTLLKKGKQEHHKYLYWEFHEQNGKQAILWHDWKYIKLNAGKKGKEIIELYEIYKDPEEKVNAASTHPHIVKQIEVLLKEAHVPDKNWPLLPDEK